MRVIFHYKGDIDRKRECLNDQYVGAVEGGVKQIAVNCFFLTLGKLAF